MRITISEPVAQQYVKAEAKLVAARKALEGAEERYENSRRNDQAAEKARREAREAFDQVCELHGRAEGAVGYEVRQALRRLAR